MMRNIFIFLLFICCAKSYTQVGIGTTDPKGALDVNSSTQGLVIPRVSDYSLVTTPDGSPAVDGTLVYDTTLKQLVIRIDGSWVTIGKSLDGESVETNVVLPFSFDGQIVGQGILGQPDDYIGQRVAISDDGSIIAFASVPFGNNFAKVYQNNNGTWTQLGNTINNSYSGVSVSVALNSSGTILAFGVGAGGSGTSNGIVKVFELQSGSWTQIGGDIIGNSSNGDVSLGASIDISNDGSIIAVGDNFGNTPGVTDSSKGRVRVYEHISGNWTQIGSDLIGDNHQDRFGEAVSLSSDGQFVAVGAPTNPLTASSIGYVRIFENTSGNWTQVDTDIVGENGSDRFGFAIDLSSDASELVIGAPDIGFSALKGYVKIFEKTNGVFNLIGNKIEGNSGELFGNSVSISNDGNIIAVGALLHIPFYLTSDSGLARIYQNQSQSFIQVGPDILGSYEFESLGESLALSSNGSTLVVGSPGFFVDFDSQGGLVQVFN